MGTFGPVNDEQVDYLQKIADSGKHLLSLINDVLDMSKIQAGMMKLFIEDDFEVAKEVGSSWHPPEKLLEISRFNWCWTLIRHIPESEV